MSATREDVDKYAAGQIGPWTAQVEEELRTNPSGEAARYLERLASRLANPFEINWRLIMQSTEQAPDSSAEVRRELESLILEVEGGRWPMLSLNDNRTLVNELRARLDIGGLADVSPQVFYSAAGLALRDLLVRRAQERSLTSSIQETAGAAATTLPAAILSPGQVLAIDRRFEDLAKADPLLQDVFLLTYYSGRHPPEVAILLGTSISETEQALALAQVHVWAPG
jgi:hypothetical protein